jgi:hypothetical protein
MSELMASSRRRISKVSLLALVVLTVLGATGLATVMSDVADPIREPAPSTAIELAAVDTEQDRVVLRHRSGDDLAAADYVVAVTVGDRTVEWDGGVARSDTLSPGDSAVVDLSSGRLWWGVDTASRPTWGTPTDGGTLGIDGGDAVRIRIVDPDTDLPVVDRSHVA